MKKSREYEDYYRGLWLSGTGSWPAASGFRKLQDNQFCARHHTARRTGSGFGGSEHGVFINEVFESVFECLAYYRWFRIPERLKDICMTRGTDSSGDIEILLDGAGYSASLIAEELFAMIDEYLEKGVCTEQDLHAVRMAYNGLSGFDDPIVSTIASWGPVEMVLADESMLTAVKEPGKVSFPLLLLVDSGLFNPNDRAHIRAADHFLRMTSAV